MAKFIRKIVLILNFYSRPEVNQKSQPNPLRYLKASGFGQFRNARQASPQRVGHWCEWHLKRLVEQLFSASDTHF